MDLTLFRFFLNEDVNRSDGEERQSNKASGEVYYSMTGTTSKEKVLDWMLESGSALVNLLYGTGFCHKQVCAVIYAPVPSICMHQWMVEDTMRD